MHLLRRTYAKWNADDGWLYAAAVAAFAALALGPLLVITLRVAQWFGNDRAVLRGLALVIVPIAGHGSVRTLVGAAGGSSSHAAVTTVVAIVVALFAGSRLFYGVQRALHKMWETDERHTSSAVAALIGFFAGAVLSVAAIGVLATIVLGSAAMSAAARQAHADAMLAAVAVRVGIAALGALVIFPFTAGLFRWLPGNDLTWVDVWPGALVTTIGFAIAQLLIGAYLARVDLPWTYGSAASLIVLILWCYYSAYLFLLGAEFTQVYACDRRERARR